MIKSCSYASLAMLGIVAVSMPAAAQSFDDRSIRGTWALLVEGYVGEGLINDSGAAEPSPGTPLFAIARGGGGEITTTARFIIEAKKKLNLIADSAELGIFGGGTLIRQSRQIN